MYMTLSQLKKERYYKRMNIIVDPEFEALIPPLSDEEFSQLRENIIESQMVRDPIVVVDLGTLACGKSNNECAIIDGHHRWRIIQEFPDDVPFAIQQETFLTRDEVKEWMIRNQLGRRNIPDYVRVELALRLKPLIAERAKKNQSTHTEDGYQGLSTLTKAVDTRSEIAAAANVSTGTVSKVERIVKEASEDTKKQLRTGELSINKAYNSIKQGVVTGFEDIKPDSVVPEASRKRLHDLRQIQTCDSLISEIQESRMLLSDAVWKNVAYNPDLYKTDGEKERVAAELKKCADEINILFYGLANRIMPEKKK